MARLPLFLAAILSLLPIVLAQSLPLHSSSRWILDSNGARVKLRCVNWAGHMETNIPEGLDKQSIPFIADWIRDNGFNCVRLTYSVDHALSPSTLVSSSFSAAASAASVPLASMQTLYGNVLTHNPSIAGATTRDVFGAVVDNLWARGIMTVLDNHVSKASWCCNLTDGNGWWDSAFGYNAINSRYFNTQDWLAGLQAMASWARTHPGVVAMSLRNELRAFLLQDLNGRRDWYALVRQGGGVVHAANPDVLVVVGGVLGGTDLSHVRSRMLDTSGWAGKHVWEMHAYSYTVNFPDPLGSCEVVQAEYGAFSGFVLEQGQPYTAPLLLSEFGVGMSGGSEQGLNTKDSRYLQCLVDYMQNNDADWAVWALQGSYYVRDGVVDWDEGWGLLNHDWSGWRNGAFKGMLGNMWKVTQQP
ncbi:glycoside hydrolase family 5 protein [Podospora appendiculata]|uniref:Glycoside hydrolase family 5 protein n=1 Tax=Podospora appendiculata TaxID=314037 RepID=A0AAE1CF73_9PEZI|nr:glycoside hydrolase family 5 protein [Podospora appendiculata]